MKRVTGIGLLKSYTQPLLIPQNDLHNTTVPTYGGATRLRRQDYLLLAEGGSADRIELYLDLLYDDRLAYCLNKQFSEICTRNWQVVPGGDSAEDKACADFCQKQLENLSISRDAIDKVAVLSNAIGFDTLRRSLMIAEITGLAPAEIIWQIAKTDRQVVVDYIKPHDVRSFAFDVNAYGSVFPKMLTRFDSIKGKLLPERKFIFHRVWSLLGQDPLGDGLGKFLYWPIQWRREAMTFWLAIVDRHADPPAVVEYPRTANETQVDRIIAAVSNINREAAIALQEGFKLRYETNTGVGNADSVSKLVDTCDKAISMLVLGEATTGEESGGSQARETINNSIRVQNAKQMSDNVNATIEQTLLKWLRDFNFPNAEVPHIDVNWQDVDEILTIAKDYKTIGLIAESKFIEKATGVPIAPAKPKPGPPKIPGA